MEDVFERIIERLKTERGRYWSDNSEYGTGKWCGFDESIGIVTQAELEYNDGWIPCSERLPEIHGVYIVTERLTFGVGTTMDRVAIRQYIGGHGWVHTEGPKPEVLAWWSEPCPRLYREESHGETSNKE